MSQLLSQLRSLVRNLLAPIDHMPLQVVITIALVIGIALPVVGVVTVEVERQRDALVQQLEAEHEQMVAVLASGLREPMWNLLPDEGLPLAQALLLDERVTAVSAQSTLQPDFIVVREPERRTSRVLTRSAPVYRGQEYIGTVTIELSTALLDRTVAEWRWSLMVITLVQFGVGALVIGGILRHKVVQPLGRLDRETQEIAAGDWRTPLSWARRDEIGRLGRHLEGMRATLMAQFAEIEERTRALEENERRYRRLVEILPDATLTTAGTRIFLANPAAAAFFGYPDPNALEGVDYLDLVPEDHREADRVRTRQMLENADPEPPFERVFLNRAGPRRTGEVRALPLGSDNPITGRLPGALVVIRDISQTKEHRRQIQEKTLLLDAIFANISEGVLLTGPEGRIALVSRGFFQLYSLPPDSVVVGMPLADALENLEQALRSAENGPLRLPRDLPLEGQSSFHEEELATGRVLEVRRQRFPDGSLFSIHIDITDRKRAEDSLRRHGSLLEQMIEARTQALREADERLRSAIHAMPDGFAFFDGQDHIVITNRHYEDLFGLERLRGGLIGRHIDEVLAEIAQANGYEQDWLEDSRSWFAEPQTTPRERRQADGRWLRLAARKVTGGGTVVIASDITEVKTASAALQVAKEEAEYAYRSLKETQESLVAAEKLASLGGLVAGIAHEINTPIGIGVTAASLIADRSRHLNGLLDQKQLRRNDLAQYLNQTIATAELVLTNLRRASELIQSFKQVAADQASAERRVFNLKSYIDEILTSLGPRLKKGKQDIIVSCPGDLMLDNYPGALSQIITNLVMNAMIHGFGDDTSGCIEITVQSVNRDIVEFRFADNGKGIAPSIRNRVFEPFVTTKRGAGGTGLGLHIVFNLVTQTLRGTIALDSERIHGTAFTIRFPKDAVTTEDARQVAVAAAEVVESTEPDQWRKAFYEDRRFRFGEIYVNVMDRHGRLLIHPPRPDLEGRPMPHLTDAAGRPFINEILRVALEKGEGWVQYYWQNPVTDRIEPKTSFIKAVPSRSVLVYVGIYKPAGHGAE